jgi:hypothetical protein
VIAHITKSAWSQAVCDAVIDIAPDEWALLRDELRRIVPALDRLFHPDQFNSALLMAESDLDAGRQAAGIRPRCPALGATCTEPR